MLARWLAALGLMIAPLLMGATPTPDASEPPALQRWEHGGAQIQLSRVRALTQRLAKQNLLYQLHLAGVEKDQLLATSREIDTVIEALRLGSPSLAVPEPPTPQLRDAIDGLDEAWGPLRRLALANTFDYARSAKLASDRGARDPLLVRHFDDLADSVDERASRAQQLYVGVCEQARHPDCQSIARATTSGMLSERMVKEAVLVMAGYDAQANMQRLRKSRAAMGRVLELTGEQEPVQAAMSGDRGQVGVMIGGLWVDIGGNWERLRREVDAVIEDRSEEVDVGEMLALQQAFRNDIQRLAVAVRSFAVARRNVSAGPP